jgi:hypothetical protein
MMVITPRAKATVKSVLIGYGLLFASAGAIGFAINGMKHEHSSSIPIIAFIVGLLVAFSGGALIIAGARRT